MGAISHPPKEATAIVRLRWIPAEACVLCTVLIALCAAGEHAARTAPAVTEPLSWLVGTWVGTRVEPATSSRASVVSKITSVLGGAGQQESVEIRLPKGVYRGLYLQVFDPKLDRSVLMYVNATRREFARLEGTATATGGEGRNVSTQGSHRSKLVYEHPSERQWRRTQYVSEDEGKTWSVLFIDELHRKNGRR